jgi:hypothetical protein
VGQTINGLLNSSDDRDYFRTRLERGKRYTIRVDGDQPTLKLVDAQNKVLRQYAAGNPAVLTGITVPTTGTYYLAVDDDSDTGNSYILSLKTP